MKLDHYREKVLEAVAPLPCETVPLGQAAGRFLAGPALARVAAPPHTCSAMDGYAVRAADVEGRVSIHVTQTLYAGDLPGPPLGAGEAARIFTGAPLPGGADAVIREEAARVEGEHVRFARVATPGENVRRAGEDVARGDLALPPGTRLGARQLALCAAVDVGEVQAVRRPRVALLSTGDELLRRRVPDSNGVALEVLLRSLGAEVSRHLVGDDPEALAAALSAAADRGDAAVTIGGVSVGEKDHVPEALGRLSAEILVHGVPMKPGRPFLFARLRGRPVMGLPGSPSACLVAFEVFARPALLRLAGAARLERRRLALPLAEPVSGRAGRARFVWAALGTDGRVRPIGRDAAQVRGPALADALVHLAEGSGEMAAGDPVETWLLEDDAA